MPLIARPPQISFDSFVYTDVNSQYLIDANPLIVHDIEAINQQIINILSTVIGDRIFEPEFGSSITSYLFDPEDPLTAYKMSIELKVAMARWMPRIVVDLQNTKVTDLGERTFNAHIAYSVIGLGIRGSLSLILKGV